MAHAPASLVARIGQRLRDRCDRLDDAILRWVLRAMLAASVGVFALDVAQTYNVLPEEAAAPSAPGTLPGPLAEPLPAVRRGSEDKPGNPLRRTDPQLAGRMAFDLVGDGRLMATGTIEPGTAQAFAAEIAKRGSYVKTVVLHSPGGFVADALAMGRMIRQKKYATEVESGRYCASSCPLVLAGGTERRAGDRAAIGVHQIFAPAGSSGGSMESAQRASAEIQKYLRDMGIDLGVWVHAMETPKDELFYFKPDELLSLRLATEHGGKPAPLPAAPPARGRS